MDGGVFVGGVLQLDDNKGNTVHEKDDIGSLVGAALDHRELVDGKEFVLFGMVEIDDLDIVTPDIAILPVIDFHVFRKQAMKGFVARHEIGAWRLTSCLRAASRASGGIDGLMRIKATLSRSVRITSPNEALAGATPSGAISGP